MICLVIVVFGASLLAQEIAAEADDLKSLEKCLFNSARHYKIISGRAWNQSLKNKTDNWIKKVARKPCTRSVFPNYIGLCISEPKAQKVLGFHYFSNNVLVFYF